MLIDEDQVHDHDHEALGRSLTIWWCTPCPLEVLIDFRLAAFVLQVQTLHICLQDFTGHSC